jgi:hypothetical protein
MVTLTARRATTPVPRAGRAPTVGVRLLAVAFAALFALPGVTT